MLLLSDRVGEDHRVHRALAAAQPCAAFSLDEALNEPVSHPMIACDVAMHTDTAVSSLRAVLSVHRADPRVPLIVVMRDDSVYSKMQARSFAPTEVLPHDVSDHRLVATVKRVARDCRAAAAAKPKSATTAKDFHEVALTLARLMNSVRRKEAVSIADLNHGAEYVLRAVRQADIREWLNVVRRYDDVTYQHCLLVAGLTSAFAIRLGLAAASQRLLSQAALIHDIGKANVPHAILTKAAALTPDEMAVMRKHAATGHAMLAQQQGIDPTILDVVRHHHEYLDGTGYPDRLQATQISDFVRIVTICDIYAALIEKRPYKPPMAPQQGYAILLEMGQKLDGSLVKAFESVIRAC